MSALSFGAASLGQEFGEIDVDEGLRAVRVALDCGINFFDTSPYYGRGMSEVLLGIALRGVPRDSYFVQTKLGRYDVDKFDFTSRRVIESVDVSLHRLGVEHVDVMLCHDVEFADLGQIVGETLPALREVQRQGKVRSVGVSGYPIEVLRRLVAEAELDVVLSYGNYTLQNRALAELMPFLLVKEVGVVNASPFDMRLLTGAPPPAWHPAPAAVREACRRAAEHCARRGASLAKLAFQFSSRLGGAATCLSGTALPDEVRQLVEWLGQPIDEQLLGEVEGILAPVRDVRRAVGRPENN